MQNRQSNVAPTDRPLQPGDVTAELRLPGAGLGAGIGLAVLSVDSVLLDTIEEVVSADHAISIAQNDVELADLILSTNCGVALLDAAAVPEELERFTARLRAQFPDLVLIVAGGSGHQSLQAAQIASSEVYRFLHKPVSAQRIRAFVDAALRRHAEEHALRATSEADDAARAAATAVATPASRGPQRMPRAWVYAAAAVAVLAIAAWVVLRDRSTNTVAAVPGQLSSPATPATPAPQLDAATRRLLAAADQALLEGRLVAPADTSAVALYRQVLARVPTDARTAAGLDNVVAVLLTQTEQSLAAGRLDEATRALDSARLVRPDNVRIAYVQAQLGKERERESLTRARTATAASDEQRQQLEAKAADSLNSMEQRLRSGALLEPAGDSARFHLERARSLAPLSVDVERASNAFRQRLVNEARGAIGRADAAATSRWLRAAAENGVPAIELDALRTQLATAESNSRTSEVARLSGLVAQRIAQNRLIEPANDSARSYYDALRAIDASSLTTEALRQPLGKAMLAEARTAVSAGDAEAASRWIAQAEAVGVAAGELAALRGDVELARGRQQQRNAVVGATALKRVRFVEPTYPRSARARSVSGWVDMEFTVAVNGSVEAIRVVGAEPGGVFENAAVEALGKWRFEPMRREGSAVEQRARLRLRFSAD